jgi:hypothetical protein
MHRRRAGIAAGAIALALSHAALAGEAAAPGDGSGFVNPALAGSESECSFCTPNPPDELFEPMRFDWSLALRGGWKDDGTGSGPAYEMTAEPELKLEQNTIRGGYDFGLSGDISYKLEGDPRLGSVTATAGGRYDLDELTTLNGRATLTVSQDDPEDSDQPVNVAEAPVEISGEVEASASRDLGLIVVSLHGSAGRDLFGETAYTDDTTSSNDYRSTTGLGGGGRIGVKLAPGLQAFADAGAEAEQYDADLPTLLTSLDNVTYEGRIGLTARPNETLEFEASIGLGYRDFADDTLGDFSAMLYDARAVFRPDEALALSAELTTTISSPGTTSGATAKLEYAAKASAEYTVNPWLRLRASALWSTASYEGIDTEEHDWGLGVGADYLLNAHTDLTADYKFERSETTPDPATDAHQVTVGVKFHR